MRLERGAAGYLKKFVEKLSIVSIVYIYGDLENNAKPKDKGIVTSDKGFA